MKGAMITTLNEAIWRIRERKPFYFRDKFMAAGFLEHWSVVRISTAMRYKNLWCAVRIGRMKANG